MKMTDNDAMSPSTEDAIKYLEGMIFPQDFSPSTLRAVAVNKMAIDALLAQRERDNPKPLTLDELREESEQNEFCGAHIWIKDLESGWVTVAITDETAKDGIIGVWRADANDVYCEKDYGKTWLAYRTRPKEAQK